MSAGPIEQLTLPYDPSELLGRVAKRRAQVRSRIISLGITVVILVAIYFWRRKELQEAGAGFFAVYGLVLGVSLAWLATVLILFLRARKALRAVGQGIALRIGRPGVELAGTYASWPEIASLSVTKAKLGRSPALQLKLADGRETRVGLDQVSVFPATLDTAARAFSGGRHGVDLSALEN